MDIMKLMAEKAKNNWDERSVTIAFFGDSVTQGCFEIYRKNEDEIETVFDKEHAYHSYIARILSILFPSVPVNIINAGISGDYTSHALERIERDVIKYNPDLTVVCFGLNDSGNGTEKISEYTEALEQIFLKLQGAKSEVIFMTPNMMNTNVSCHITDNFFREIAKDTMKRQNDGVYEQYLNQAKEVCKNLGITVCDCYKRWRTLYDNGVDVTELLSNKINHPTREMNWLFAISLVETMFK